MPNSNGVTLVALLNAMIGGTILILPLLFLKSGIMMAFIITTLTGLINYYSCKICLDHLQDDPDLPTAIRRHTTNPMYPIIYDLCVFFSVILIELLYFDLIVKQWTAILGVESEWIAIVNAVFLLGLVFAMKKLEMGVTFLGYGIMSIFGYLIFLTWMLSTSPTGDKKFVVWSFDFATLCDTLATAFSLQGVFIPILKQNTNQQYNHKLLLLAYVFGGSIYAYIGYAGAYGVLNRQSLFTPAETVEDFFPGHDWEVVVIAIIYLVHLYSVFPEYLMISKKCYYGALKIEQTLKKDVFFIAVFICICLLVYFSKMSLQTILAINGSLFGFFFVYLLPLSLHVKCVYYPEKTVQMIEIPPTKQAQQVQMQKYANFENENRDKDQSVEQQPNKLDTTEKQNNHINMQTQPLGCGAQTNSQTMKYVSIGLLALMFAFGIFVLIYSLLTLVYRWTH